MERGSNGKFNGIMVLLGLMILGMLLMNICIGSVRIPLREVIAVFRGGTADPVNRDIVLQLRFPRALAAMLLGGGLALSGYLLQTYFHNPIAGPYILGISSGAKLMVAVTMVVLAVVAVTMVVLAGNLRAFTSVTMIAAAFLGAMMAMGLVLLVARVVHNMAVLVVAGVMIGYICSAITEIVVTFAADSDIVNLHNWSRGSFSGITWNNVLALTVITVLCVIAAVIMAKSINAYQMGEQYASSVGVNVKVFRVLLVLVSSLLSATVTAFAGPVSFVGIAVPHLIRTVLHTADPKKIIPGCLLGGGLFCLVCDFLARTMLSPTEMNISTVTAIFGAPVVIAMLLRRQKEREVSA